MFIADRYAACFHLSSCIEMRGQIISTTEIDIDSSCVYRITSSIANVATLSIKSNHHCAAFAD